jgi:hypothetical protein
MCLLVLTILMQFGCSHNVQEATTINEPKLNNLKIIELDGCEYYVIENVYPEWDNYSISLTHKGNCKQCKPKPAQ